jgi:hypothetical protein
MMPGKNPVKKKAEIILRYERGVTNEKEDNSEGDNSEVALNCAVEFGAKINIDAITPNVKYKKLLESQVVLKVNVRLICLFESNSNNMKLNKKIKTPNEIGSTGSIGLTKSNGNTKFLIKKNEITPKRVLNKNMNRSANDLFSVLDVDKDSI